MGAHECSTSKQEAQCPNQSVRALSSAKGTGGEKPAGQKGEGRRVRESHAVVQAGSRALPRAPGVPHAFRTFAAARNRWWFIDLSRQMSPYVLPPSEGNSSQVKNDR